MADTHSICVRCGEQLNSSDRRKMYCSKKCKLAAWKSANKDRYKEQNIRAYKASANKRWRNEYSRISSGYCIRCGKPYAGKNKLNHCSVECYKETQRDIAREKYKESHSTIRSCVECGCSFDPEYTGGRKTIYCSDACKSVAIYRREKANRKIGKAKRRAVYKGVYAESVDPFKVFDRDRWRCMLCGCKTPKSKRGTYADDAPELDHIIPISKGGQHTYMNTQCACRKCNHTKSDKPLGQMLLIG